MAFIIYIYTAFQIHTLPCRDSNRQPTAWQADDLPMSQLACSDQGTLYTREGYGSAYAVVNQL